MWWSDDGDDGDGGRVMIPTSCDGGGDEGRGAPYPECDDDDGGGGGDESETCV